MAEADDHRAGERREVDHHLWLVLALRPGHRVGKDEPPFSIGVDDLDRLARHRGDDVAGPLGIAVRHVLGERADANHVCLRLAAGERHHRAGDGAGAAHVPLHCFHAGSGLDRDASGVEGDALANEHDRRLIAAAVPAHREQPRWPHRSLGDAEQRAHAEFPHRGLVEHFEGDAERLQCGAGALDEAFRVDDVRRLADQRAGEIEPGQQRRFAREGVFGPRAGADDDDLLQRRLLLARQLGAIMIVAPGTRRGAEGELGAGRSVEPLGIDHERRLARQEQPRGERGAGPFPGRIIAGAADSDQQHPARHAVVIDEGFRDRPGIAFEPLRLRRAHDERSRRFGKEGQPVVQHVVAAHRHGERIGAFRARDGEACIYHDSLPMGADPRRTARHCRARPPVQ